MKYAWIQEHSNEFPVALMCKLLNVSRSGYYESLSAPESKRKLRREEITEAAVKYYYRSNGIYGYRKVYADLQKETNLSCSSELVRRVLSSQGLHSKTRKKYRATTNSKHNYSVADNVLNRDFQASRCNEKWVSDITYISTKEGWLYLAGVMDLYSRFIVGWATSPSLDSDFVCDALGMAIDFRRPDPGLIIHSDRGVQYASNKYQALLSRHGLQCSMSRLGNCWDNASQESFWGKLKTEWLRDKSFSTRFEARAAIAEYIEIFYNRIRRHACLGYVSPAEYEKHGGKEGAA